ncbi:hypothetical protein [Nocardia salmonicida]|uniref:hypothetical protein n=1 Tax=Nocardia salmonicida TaxID=53431 RepID=UPI000ABEAA6B|nr:hypothetical protein [Nocardia salmonicida]
MIGDEGAARSAFVVRDSAELMLVAADTAGTGGETLAASALAYWRLPLEPGMARTRALVAGAAAATSPLRRLCVRLVLLDGAVLLEVVFLDAEPHDYESALMPAEADWSWRRDSDGRWHLCDRIDLHPRRT